MIRRFDDKGTLKPSLSKMAKIGSPQPVRPEISKTASLPLRHETAKGYTSMSKRVKTTHEFAADALNPPAKAEKNLIPAAIRRTAYASSLDSMRTRWSSDYFTYQKPLIYFTNPSKTFFLPCKVFYQEIMNSNESFHVQSLAEFHESLSIHLLDASENNSVEIGSIRKMNEDSPNFHKLYALMRLPGGNNDKISNEDEHNHLATAEYCFRKGIIAPQDHTIANALLCKDTSLGATASMHQAVLDNDIPMVHYLIEKGGSVFSENSNDNLTSFDLALKSEKQEIFDTVLSKIASKDDLASLALLLKYESETLTDSQKLAITAKLDKPL